jgi:iron complex outermembrane receptor protein
MPSVREETKAAFGQATLSLTDRLRLVGGLRYTKDNKGRDGANKVGVVGVSIVDFQCVDCTVTGINHADLEWTKTTWRAGLDFDVSDDSMLFASVATGYKAGGYGDGLPPNNFAYDPETLINYELGWKNQLLDNRMQINLDAFFSQYDDYQATAGSTLPNGQSIAVTLNAGAAEIKGVELESMFLLTADDRVEFNATWLDAKFTDFFLDRGDQFSPGTNFAPYDLTGNKLPYAPETTARLSYQHTFSLANGGALIARVDSSYVAKQFLEFHNFAVLSQDAYTRTGVTLTWEASEKFSTQLFVRNLENDAILAAASSDNNAPGRRFDDFGRQAFYMPPRTYGIKFTASF